MLSHIPVDSHCGQAVEADELLCENLARSLHLTEDQAPIPLREALQELKELLILLLLRLTKSYVLLDVLVDCKHIYCSGLHVDGLLQELTRQRTHLTRPGRSEQHGLPCRRDLRNDLTNLGLEAHVEHTVGLIEDQILHILELHSAALDEVVQPSRACDDDLSSTSQRAQLLATRGAAITAGSADAGGPAELVRLRLDLARKLARRGQHAYVWWTWAPLHDAGEARQEEGQRLPAACLGDADDVSASGTDRPSVGLDWRGLREACVLEPLNELLREDLGTLVESRDCRRHLLAARAEDMHLLHGTIL
mmetsp:Transcript_80165/g.206337  ORF Transcript_80165/g.206337 Transcript_80165/m.206337 type:complete len:307 (-) Transcript_80165:280-1200(-)